MTDNERRYHRLSSETDSMYANRMKREQEVRTVNGVMTVVIAVAVLFFIFTFLFIS